MVSPRLLLLAPIFLLLLPIDAHAQLLRTDQPGFNPRDLAVGTSPAGQEFAIVTSDGSHAVSLFVDDAGPFAIDVGSRSWDACAVDASTVVVSLLDVDGIAVLRFDPLSGMFDLDGVYSVPGINLMQSTRLLAVPGSRRVLVANRGEAPDSPRAESWSNAVYELEIPATPGTPTLARTFVTEAEPSSLALSPDGRRLFVGTIKGALGGQGIAFSSALTEEVYDGGSIVMYDFQASANTPRARFHVGSPVRDLAIWSDTPTGGSVFTHYRLFFTHVGAGAAGEDPEFGGRSIPNAVSEIVFDIADHQALSRRDMLFSHCPDGPGGPGCDDVHVVPEDLLVVGQGDDAELYVTLSGSGNVAIVDLDALGAIPTQTPDPNVFLYATEAGAKAPRVLATSGWDPGTGLFEPRLADAGDLGFSFHRIDPQSVTTIDVGVQGSVAGSSNPRGLAYSAARNEVSIVARLSQSVEHVDAATRALALRSPWITYGWGSSEPDVFVQMRRFFATGGAFDFREDELDPSDKVDNITCGTCHPNGRSDGKVRDTRTRQVLDGPRAVVQQLPVAVPTILDVGLTEWLFFEGLHTIIDNSVDNPNCTYCGANEFFLDTVDFTSEVRSPASPYAPDGNLTDRAQAGRWWFDQLNCSRCHNGDLRDFPRALVDVAPTDGPLPNDDPIAARMLHDGTQVFVSGIPNSAGPNADFAVRNMTNVGTRTGSAPIDDPNGLGEFDGVPGVNTPALADAWRHGPYLHDGRYRELDEVLRHTWVFADEGDRSAPHWTNGLVPDNFAGSFDMQDLEVQGVPVAVLWDDFQTHQHEVPTGNVTSVYDYLVERPSFRGNGTALDDLTAFLLSPSAATDPCDPGVEIQPVISRPWILAGPGQRYRLAWTTNLPTRCEVTVTDRHGAVVWSRSGIDAPIGTAHDTPELALDAGETYTATLNTHRPSGVCSTGAVATRTVTWTVRGFKTRSETPALPAAATISNVSPNPFNPRTTIEYAVPRDGRARVAIYDARGRLVRSLVDESLTAGLHRIVWNGMDGSGQAVASGVYHVQIRSGEDVDVQRMILVR